MAPQVYVDPSSGRPYYIDPTTNQAVWADQPPQAPTAPAPMSVAPAPMPMAGAPAYDPSALGAGAAAAMGIVPGAAPGANLSNVNLGSFDFSKIEDKLIILLDPAVKYEFAVTEVKGKKSSSQEDMLEVHLAVCFPTTLPNGEACRGASVIDNITLSPNALWKAKSFLAACNMLDANGRFSGRSLEDLRGCVVRSGIRNEEWNGQMRSKISGGYQPGFETPGLNVAAPAANPGAFAPPAATAPAMPTPQVASTPQPAPMPAPVSAQAPQAPAFAQTPQPMAPAPQMAPQAPQMPVPGGAPGAPQMPAPGGPPMPMPQMPTG